MFRPYSPSTKLEQAKICMILNNVKFDVCVLCFVLTAFRKIEGEKLPKLEQGKICMILY